MVPLVRANDFHKPVFRFVKKEGRLGMTQSSRQVSPEGNGTFKKESPLSPRNADTNDSKIDTKSNLGIFYLVLYFLLVSF